MPEPPASDASAAPAAPGRTLVGRYVLVRRLASGGMAEVWEATDLVLERPVAIKVLHPHLAADEVFRLRFRGEAIAAARLRHPSIVSIYDTCHDDGLEAIVMELARSQTLREYLDQQTWLSPAEVVHIGADVSDALEVAHRAGVIHRDVKPANILLCDDGRVLVTDFGIAKVRDEADLTSTGAMIGTAKYLSPEQVEGAPVDPRSDVYALGVVLYECLCGEPPFEAANPAATALARLHQPPLPPATLRPDVPPALAAVVVRALERQPERRFQSASDLRTGLLAARDHPDDPTVIGPDPSRHHLGLDPVGPGHDRTVVAAGADHTAVAASPPLPGPAPHAPFDQASFDDAPAAPLPPGRDPFDGGGPAQGGAGRRWLAPLLFLVLVAVSIGLVVALVANGADLSDEDGAPPEPPPTTPQGTPVPIVDVTTLDPAGDGEHDDKRLHVVDGDDRTSWRTETYQTADWSRAKDGVGLVLHLGEAAELGELEVTSARAGWSAEVYVADRPRGVGAWGEPVAAMRSVGSRATASLGGAEGRAVLLWFTEAGGPPYRVEITEVRLTT